MTRYYYHTNGDGYCSFSSKAAAVKHARRAGRYEHAIVRTEATGKVVFDSRLDKGCVQ